MDKVMGFLISVQNDYKSERLSVEQEITRIKEQITHIEKNIVEIKNSIDESYAVMSSSQAVNEVENTELATFKSLVIEYNKLLKDAEIRKNEYELKLSKTADVIESYKENVLKTEKISGMNVTGKLNLVAKLIKVDKKRAEEELKNLIKILDE